jgi:hypothetical protein
MLKKQAVLIDKETGEEWTVQQRTPGDTVNDAEGKPVKLYVYILRNEQMHRRFVYEHMVDREFNLKTAETTVSS